jgi:hypothetical protein
MAISASPSAGWKRIYPAPAKRIGAASSGFISGTFAKAIHT